MKGIANYSIVSNWSSSVRFFIVCVIECTHIGFGFFKAVEGKGAYFG
jgi:hypothetical protein